MAMLQAFSENILSRAVALYIDMVLLKGNIALARKISSSKQNHSIEFWVPLYS